MDQTVLYTLPKDIIIKLLVDVQHDLKREVDMYKDILAHICEGRGTPYPSYNVCLKKGCTHYSIDDGHQTSQLSHCCCWDYDCRKKCKNDDKDWWCEEHLEEGELKKLYKNIYACSFCKENCNFCS